MLDITLSPEEIAALEAGTSNRKDHENEIR